MKRNQWIHGDLGFTTIEALMVVVLIGVLTMISVIRIGTLGRPTAYTTARQLVADLRQARSLAITSAKSHIVRLYPSGGPYSEYKTFRSEIGGEVQVGVTRQISNKIACTGTGEFTFQSLGNATSDGTVVLVSAGRQYDVNIIAATGRAYEFLH